jgi:hypothetical protein
MPRISRLTILFLTACGAPMVAHDGGLPDAGTPSQRACVSSSCEAAGTWRVNLTGDAGNPVCQPVDDQVVLTSDGASVCMLRATDGGTDGGCGFVFEVAWHQTAGSETLDGLDTWSFGLEDGGHMYGAFHTAVRGISNCEATFNVHGVR